MQTHVARLLFFLAFLGQVLGHDVSFQRLASSFGGTFVFAGGLCMFLCEWFLPVVQHWFSLGVRDQFASSNSDQSWNVNKTPIRLTKCWKSQLCVARNGTDF